MQVTKISATPRTEHGKGSSRRLRAAGKLPAVAYGKGATTQAVVVNPQDLVHVLTSDLGINTLIQLDVAGESINTMIADYQYHPVSRKLLHADFIQVKDGETVDVKVPLRLTGKSKGIVMGGKLTTVFRDLPVRAVPGKIPVEIVHDITELDLDQSVSAGELQVGEGVEVLLPPKRTVALIAQDRRAKGEEGAEEGAAAPSAAAK
jgi:large subunit ribosomal protein L25